MLQLFLSALPDSTLDGPPFTLCPPDFDFQNVLVDDDGIITGIIDWDGVRTLPRQGGAAAYPVWLTVDWDPIFYDWKKPKDNVQYYAPTELASYRRAYLDAITRASGGKLTHITRNSHIWTMLHIAVCLPIATPKIIYHLSKFVFGSSVVGCEVAQGIRGSTWFALRNAPETVTEMAGKIYYTTISVLLSNANDAKGEGGGDGRGAKQSDDSDVMDRGGGESGEDSGALHIDLKLLGTKSPRRFQPFRPYD